MTANRWRPLFLLLFFALAAPIAAQAEAGRVVVLGVDGLDHALCRDLLENGELPELAALAREGAFSPLRPTDPAQSPVSWAAMLTGRPPEQTGIFGFLSREVEDGQIVPQLALARRESRVILGDLGRIAIALGALLVALLPALVRRTAGARRVSMLLGVVLGIGLAWLFDQVPAEVTLARSQLQAEPLWEGLDREGVPTTSLFVPMGFPAPSLENGAMLAGLGVPDLLGTAGTVTLHTADPIPAGRELTQMGGRRRPLVKAAGGAWEGRLEGPPNPLRDGEPVALPFTLQEVEEGRMRLRIQGAEHELRQGGAFSQQIALRFEIGAFFALQGAVRFRWLRSSEAGPVLYQEPVQIDPRAPVELLPIASDAEWLKRLAGPLGFETLGWAVATNPYQDLIIDTETLIRDADSVLARREAVLMQAAQDESWRLLLCVLETTDRIQHVLWRTTDPRHPSYDAEEAREHGDVIARYYRRIDRIVGRLRAEVLGQDDVLLVLSDHGFAPFRRAVNLNRWLAEEGYLFGRADGGRRLEGGLGEPVFRHIDWSRTKAYHLGLGRIWLNLSGREPQGIVPRSERESLLAELTNKLMALEDRGERVVHRVHRPGPHERASDLVVGFERGWRVSWASCLGGLGEPVFRDNLERWSGDHCSTAPELVPGVLFSSRPLAALAERAGMPTILDVLPTLRGLLGLPADESLTGADLR